MTILLDGKAKSEQIKKDLSALSVDAKLAVVLVGDSAASATYVANKKRMLEDLGMECDVHKFSTDISESDLLGEVEKLNNDNSVTGILVQLPLPGHVDIRTVLDSIDYTKDVDGLHSYHLTRILLGDERIVPCTPKGILTLLDAYDISLSGKNVCIIGFSDVVGKPLSVLCLNRRATVTVCHRKTVDLKEHTLAADIIMVATGQAGLITSDMVSDGSVVIDIGISRVDGKLVGDVDYETVSKKCSYISPVPGGVGPMTVISLAQNLVELKNNG